MIERLRARRFSLLETIGLLALGLWSAEALSHALTVPGVAPGETARASDIQQIVAAVSALEAKLQYVTVLDGAYKDMAGPHLVIRGANLHLESGSGQTSDGGAPTGLGNLVVGYG
ncbi:MAG: hypothetical protein K8I02_11105, partial [Candidatus Methylomirabilis sp.]|nr:hypothetical protein [Deltaproteobacteria bacterium]